MKNKPKIWDMAKFTREMYLILLEQQKGSDKERLTIKERKKLENGEKLNGRKIKKDSSTLWN